MSDRLFVPLESVHYRNFESFDKDVELRGVNNQFNRSTVREGRRVELRRGYSTGDSLWGTVGEVWTFNSLSQVTDVLDHHRILPDATEREFLEQAAELLEKYDEYIAFQVILDDRVDQVVGDLVADGGIFDSDRQRLVEIMALLDEVDNKFNGLGSQQSMSVGPVLADVAALREELVERGKGYGILPKSATEGELRHEAYHHVEVEARYLDTGKEHLEEDGRDNHD